jgi:hypothetical protein
LSQILTYMPKYQFDKIIEKFKGNYKAQEFSCWEQYVCMVFAQLTYRESLRDIESCLEAFGSKLYHCGIKSKVAKSTLAYWNEKQNGIFIVNMLSILLAMHGSCIRVTMNF